MKPLLTVVLVISTVIYIIIGGAIMHVLEWDFETARLSQISLLLDQATRRFLDKHRCVNETELLELLETVVEADQQGVVITERNVTSSHWLHDWDLSHSIYFIAVTLTTIGYGNITPKSASGRAFTAIYAMVGIPLQLVTLAAVGGWLSRAFDRCFLRPCHMEAADDYRSVWSVRKHLARMLITFAVFLVFFAIIPAFIFRQLEDWTFGDSIYYALISLTTIGFGDYEAGYKDAHEYNVNTVAGSLYKISVGIWILLGLASCASVITTMKDTYSAIVWRIEDKAVQLKDAAGLSGEKPGFGVSKATSSRSAPRSKRRVEPADSDGRSAPEHDGDIVHDDRIWIT